MTEASDLLPAPHTAARPDGRPAGTPARARRREWLAPTGLILLSLVPVAAGASRLTQLATGAVSADNTRFFDSPVPVVMHIVSVTVFSLIGALQFAPSLRRHRWHRRAGRIVAPAGLLTALTGIWMALFYTLPAHDGQALLVLRLVFGTAMAASIVVAFIAIRKGDVRTHSAWMTRAYAIGMGAGTQVFTLLPAQRRSRRTPADDRRRGVPPRTGGGDERPAARTERDSHRRRRARGRPRRCPHRPERHAPIAGGLRRLGPGRAAPTAERTPHRA